MTANKRFTVNEFKRICDYENEINQEVVCIKLNVFYEMKEELKKENEELKQTIKTICKDYENHHGMDIRNAEWFTAW